MAEANASIKRQTTALESTTTAEIIAPTAANPKAEAEATTSLDLSPKTKAQVLRQPHLNIKTSQALGRIPLAGPRMRRPRLVTATATAPAPAPAAVEEVPPSQRAPAVVTAVVTAMTCPPTVNSTSLLGCSRRGREGSILRWHWIDRGWLRCL